MNIAILIGISKYKSEAQLPACARDVENMRRLLMATKKYDDIQCINDQTNASQVKDSLRAFFAKHQNTPEISEALIYFSGHGVYQNDALLCCSDFDINRPATTSVSNAELDDLLRSIKPEVAIKIIDACQSGSPYIKDASAGFEKALGASHLNSFICMASSRQDQSSYATPNESAFTAQWIDAAISKDAGTILYRDIQAALADAFVTNPDQTPFFVNQGTGLEAFCTVSDEIRQLANQRSKSVASEKPEDAILQIIEQAVTKRDKNFVKHDAAISASEQSKTAIINQEISDEIVSKLYEKSVSTDLKLSAIPQSRAVAQFADEQTWQKKYFTKIKYETYKVKVPKDPLNIRMTLSSLMNRIDESEYVLETRSRPSSLEPTESLPFEVAEISFSSNHPSLPAFLVYVGIVHSLTDVMVLSSTVRLTQKGWTERTPELSEVQWRYQSFAWAEVVRDPPILWRDAINRGEQDIRAYLEALIPISESTRDDSTLSSPNDDASVAAL